MELLAEEGNQKCHQTPKIEADVFHVGSSFEVCAGALLQLFLLFHHLHPFFTIFCNIDPLLLPGPLSLRSCRSTLEVICVWKSVLAFWHPLVLQVPSTGRYSLQGRKRS